MTVLAIVRSRRMQADQRYAAPLLRAGLLEIDAMIDAVDLEPQVAADHGVERRRHDQLSADSRRGSASRSLKNWRCCSKGRKSPSIEAAPRLVKAKRSCQPGGGMACQC